MAFFRARVHKPKVTFVLIAVCAVIFFAEYVSPAIYDYFSNSFSFVPAFAFSQPWRFVTSIFLHASIEHIFFNMFALFIFGIYLESVVGIKHFLSIFFLAGVLGNLAYLVLSPSGIIPAVGASGAIYGVMGMLAAMRPKLIVYVGYIPMPMVAAAFIWTLTEFFGLFVPSGVAHEAHIAGLAIGIVYGLIMRHREKYMSNLVFR